MKDLRWYEVCLITLIVIVMITNFIVGTMSWTRHDALVRFNEEYAQFGEYARMLEDETGCRFNVQCEYAKGDIFYYDDIPYMYTLVCVEDTRYHISGFLGCAVLYVDGYLVEDGWDDTVSEIKLLKSRIDCGF